MPSKVQNRISIYVDADACPVKNEVIRVAERYGCKVVFVSNSRMRILRNERVEGVVVDDRLITTDDWIVEHAGDGSVVITADIPLASRCLKKGARVLDPKGRIFDEESIGGALADRELSAYLRGMGNITGGPAPFEKRDRSRFLQNLDNTIQAAVRGKR